MKKIFLLAAALLITSAGFAQRHSVARLFEDAAKIEGAQLIDLNEMGGSINISTPGIQIDKMELIRFENANTDTRERVSRLVRNLNDSRYETYVSVVEGGNNVRILGKKGGEKLTEMVILVEGSETVLIRFTGDLDKDAILGMVQSNR